MLDASAKASVSLSSVSGTLVRTHPKSFFQACHQSSGKADDYYGGNRFYVVLQVMCISDGWLMFELVSRQDWDEGRDDS